VQVLAWLVLQDGVAAWMAELQQRCAEAADLRVANAKLVDQCAAAESRAAGQARQQEAALRQAQQARVVGRLRWHCSTAYQHNGSEIERRSMPVHGGHAAKRDKHCILLYANESMCTTSCDILLCRQHSSHAGKPSRDPQSGQHVGAGSHRGAGAAAQAGADCGSGDR